MSESRHSPPKIDAHHHLWHYTPEEYGWIGDDMSAIRKDFLEQDLIEALASANVDGSIVVQAQQTLEETHRLLSVAERTPQILGVIGWVDLTSALCRPQLEKLSEQARLVGLRHVVQAEPDGFLSRGDFNHGVDLLDSWGLAYDLLIHERQLVESIRFADRHAGQNIVLDHIAKPKIATAELQPWATQIRNLARRDHISCKVSGLVTEAAWNNWSLEMLRPYLDTVLEAFGPERLLAGSDWPVCLLASGYRQWWEVLEQYFAPLSEDERAAIFGGNAVRVYALEPA